VVLAAATATSCTTTYDAYGRPVQSVDPGTATLGIAAAGLAGYAIGNDRDRDRRRYYGSPYRRSYDSPYRRSRGYDSPYRRGGYYAPYHRGYSYY
jgi:hypothetical protein